VIFLTFFLYVGKGRGYREVVGNALRKMAMVHMHEREAWWRVLVDSKFGNS
jgi:hypothetical protein